MKNILFVANTQGHLLTLSSLIFETFNPGNGYQPYILQVKNIGTARFNDEPVKSLLSPYYYEVDQASLNTKNEISEILHTTFDRVFLFLEQLSLSVYLSAYFKKRGAVICLAPDGNKPYFTVDRLALRSRLIQTKSTYKFLFKRGLYYFKPYFTSWNYARLTPVDELWLTYPERFHNVRNKKLVKFRLLPNETVTNKVIEFFRMTDMAPLHARDRVIFYATNILFRQEAYDVEIEAIKGIQQRFPGVPFYLKYHPSTPASQVKAFESLGVTCFCNARPAELYIAALTNSIVLGFWSASLMIDNPSCKFYWLHNYLVKRGKMVTDLVNLENPTQHIIDIDDLDKITF